MKISQQARALASEMGLSRPVSPRQVASTVSSWEERAEARVVERWKPHLEILDQGVSTVHSLYAATARARERTDDVAVIVLWVIAGALCVQLQALRRLLRSGYLVAGMPLMRTLVETTHLGIACSYDAALADAYHRAGQEGLEDAFWRANVSRGRLAAKVAAIAQSIAINQEQAEWRRDVFAHLSQGVHPTFWFALTSTAVEHSDDGEMFSMAPFAQADQRTGQMVLSVLCILLEFVEFLVDPILRPEAARPRPLYEPDPAEEVETDWLRAAVVYENLLRSNLDVLTTAAYRRRDV